MKKMMLIVSLLLLCCCTPVFGFEAEDLPTGDYLPMQIEELEEDSSTGDEEVCYYSPGIFLLGSDEDSTEIPEDEYYGYQVLKEESNRYAKAYLSLLNGLTNGEAEIQLSVYLLSRDEFNMVLMACLNDHPELYYVNSSGGLIYRSQITSIITRFLPDYIEDLHTEESAASFEAAVDSILAESGARQNMSDYDKAIMIHNELASRISYDHASLAAYQEAYNAALQLGTVDAIDAEIVRVKAYFADIHTAYNALVEGKSVCDGYVKAYQYLLQKVGVLSHMATGLGNGGGHAWNLVRLDGKWYYTDLTWDDTDRSEVFYAYFNMTDEQLEESNHELDNPYEMPECTSTDLNYFTVNGGIMTTEGNIDNVVAQLKENSYARVYVTGDAEHVSDVWTWFEANIGEIARRIGVTGSFRYARSWMNHEVHLMLYHNTLHATPDTGVEICSTEDRQCKLISAFYDEEGRIICMNESEEISLTANKITQWKHSGAPDEYKSVKYFIWDNENGMRPLFHHAVAEYHTN